MLLNKIPPVVMQNISVGVVGVQALQRETGFSHFYRESDLALFDEVAFARPDLQCLPEGVEGLATQCLGLVGGEGRRQMRFVHQIVREPNHVR